MDIPKKLGIKGTDFRLVIGGSQIDYDASKEDINLRKHGRSLKEALAILENLMLPIKSKPFMTREAIEPDGEIRDQHMGLDREGKIVFFVTTMRPDETIRVISFRRANRNERKTFRENTGYRER